MSLGLMSFISLSGANTRVRGGRKRLIYYKCNGALWLLKGFDSSAWKLCQLIFVQSKTTNIINNKDFKINAHNKKQKS